jgi:hypothetical protein
VQCLQPQRAPTAMMPNPIAPKQCIGWLAGRRNLFEIALQ